MIYLGKWIVSKTYDSIYPDNVEAFEMVLVPPGKAPGIPVTIVQLLFYLNIKQMSISLGILVISKSTDVTTFFFEAQRIQHENGKKQEIKSQNLDNIIFSLIKTFSHFDFSAFQVSPVDCANGGSDGWGIIESPMEMQESLPNISNNIKYDEYQNHCQISEIISNMINITITVKYQ